jgi:hypothetical protein
VKYVNDATQVIWLAVMILLMAITVKVFFFDKGRRS